MKKASLYKKILFVLSLSVFAVIVACGNHEQEILVARYDASVHAYYTIVVEYTSINSDGMHKDASGSSFEIPSLFSQHILKGEGDFVVLGGDGLSWYFRVFGLDFYFIPSYVIGIVGGSSFDDWTEEFAVISSYGQRDPREANLRTFIEDFAISKDALITAQENALNMSMEEIDTLVTWARKAKMPPAVWDDEARKAFRWREGIFSLSDIQALFSNDVNEIWDAFPGYGILHNNRAYSPEWIFQNIERAVYGELLSLYDLEDVIDAATNYFGFGGDLVDTATATLQTAFAALTTPTAQQLTFNLNVGSDIVPFSATPIPATIPSMTLNAWDVIMDSLTMTRSEIPASGPTRAGYNFMGWYLDADFTVAITETFRMPARDATLYARWEVPGTQQMYPYLIPHTDAFIEVEVRP